MTDVSSLGDASDWKEGILEGESGQEKEKKNYYVHHKQPFFGKFCAVETLRNRNGL